MHFPNKIYKQNQIPLGVDRDSYSVLSLGTPLQ